jgi:hypothetical protein
MKGFKENCQKQDDKIQGKARCSGRVIAFLLSFFSGEKRKEAKKKRHFWQTAPQPKEALLRVLVARVILFVCAGATAPHVLTPLFVFFLGLGTFNVSSHCFCFLARVFLPVPPHCFFALLH